MVTVCVKTTAFCVEAMVRDYHVYGGIWSKELRGLLKRAIFSIADPCAVSVHYYRPRSKKSSICLLFLKKMVRSCVGLLAGACMFGPIDLLLV